MSSVYQWLEGLGLGRYAEAFQENEVDAEVLPSLTAEDLKDLGVSLVGHRRKLLDAIAALNEAAPGSDQSRPESQAPARGDAERRQLTVMFCDLVGSTALSAKLDPEDMAAVIRSYQECCAVAVKRWEGHVAKYMGDGVLAYFGYPMAHEDAAERAVRAALEVTGSVSGLAAGNGEPLAARVGIATGLVMVGELIGEGAAQEETVVGETPNLAARLQAVAAPGAVVIGPRTHRLVRGGFEFEDLGAQELKGILEPVPAWRVIGEGQVKSRFEAARDAGLTPLVGRDAEIAMLMERWRQTKNREGQVVMISGEPGIGKSRITETFRAAIAEESCLRLRFQCSPYHTNAAFYPIIKQFEFAAGFLRDDSDEVKLDKLEALLVPANGAVSAVAQLFAKLLSIQSGDRYPPLEGTPQKLKQITLRALVDHVCTLAGNSPVVMIFEDAHWIDPTSQEALDLIAPRIAKHPVLLVITHRPDYEADWSDLMHLTQLALNRLGRAQAATMVQKVTGGKALPDEVFEQIVARTDGVPLFVEELTKTVLESGLLEEIDGTYTLTGPLPDRAIPLTLRDSLMARLDQLAKAKQVAQIGACIGREFSHELIAVVSSLRKEELNDFLAQLTDSNLLMQTGAPPEAKYTFRHALVQDAAYESLLKSKRQVLHAEIAHSMESQFESAVDSELSSIAEHFAKGAVWPKAMEYYCRAAEQAGQGFAVKEALALYDEALKSGALLDADETAARFMSIHQAKSDLYFMIGNFESARAEYAPLLEIARRLGDKDRESTALAGRAWAAFWAEDFDSALASASEAIGVAEAVDCRTALGNAHMTTGMIHAVSGQLDQAVGELDKTLSICRSASDFLRESLTLYMSGNIENWRGKFEKAIDLASTGARVAQEHNLVTAFLRCRYAQAISLTGKGEYDEALGILNDGLALAEKIGDEAFVPRYYNGLGWLYLECEDLERGLELNKQGADLSRQRRHAQGVEMTCFAEVNMGDALLASGDLPSAQDLFEGVYRVAKNPATQEWMKWRYSTHLLASLGRFWLDRGDPSKAEEFAELCLKIAVPKGSRKYIIGAWLLLGEASIARRKWEEAERWLGKARDLAHSIGHQPQLWRSHFALGQLYAEIRRVNASRLEYRAALSVVEQIKRNTKDPGLCKSLEASPQFRQVLELAAED